MTLIARSVGQGELGAYDALAAEWGTVFDRMAWTGLFGKRLTRFGIFEEGGELVGGFCVYRERRWGLAIDRNPPFTPQCGPFVKIKAQHPVAVLEAKREAVDCMAALLERRHGPVVSLALARPVQDALPFFWRRFKVVPKYTYIVDLRPSLGALQEGMASVRRRNIAKAGKDGVQVRQTENMELVRDLALETFARQRMMIDRVTLEAILFRFASPQNSYAFTSYRGDTPIACCFVVHDQRTAYYLIGGYRSAEKHHGAGALAMWECIKRAKELGLEQYDFEGSMVPEIERYFRGFGGALTPCLTVNRAWFPLECGLKVFRRSLF